jgi:hypothetical protein
MAGEVNSFGKDFKFNYSTFNTWVSSYFFSINQPAINLIKFDILPSSDVVNKYLVGGNNEKYFFANSMDLTLKEHLLKWLFHGGWYKSERLNQDNKDRFYYKARSIIAEFSLSAKAHANNIIFLDVYFLIKLFNEIKFKVSKLRVNIF